MLTKDRMHSVVPPLRFIFLLHLGKKIILRVDGEEQFYWPCDCFLFTVLSLSFFFVFACGDCHRMGELEEKAVPHELTENLQPRHDFTLHCEHAS